ncbi:hypothetical protein BpHYR1_043880 [Brachionus plicatilis]|uniref:Uncharacterized protein n=1 Tax=Brachionus plicatilis TaxID=10195 RepID=A0A3M7T828_BRAPC|nr:hypothetical protein BpHYR1_043880 [Brachionus plicatilis]
MRGRTFLYKKSSLWPKINVSATASLTTPFFLLLICCLQQAVAEAEYFELKPGVGAEIEVGYLNHLKHNALITGIVESELEKLTFLNFNRNSQKIQKNYSNMVSMGSIPYRIPNLKT